MKKLFEKWVVANFGEEFRESLKGFDKNGYPDEIINAMWIGFNGYAILSSQA